MAKVFISYSSQDRKFVDRLADDLDRLGHEIWLDRWKIKVGEDIFDKIRLGIRNSQYAILVLSNNSAKSGWVDKEWKMVYWDEITTNQVKLLPVLVEKCDIPDYLKFKKYADFTKGYLGAFNELVDSLKPISKALPEKKVTAEKRKSRLSFGFFKKIYDFAYSSHGLDMTKDSAKTFAFSFIESHDEKDFPFFVDVFEFAYSSDGLDLTRGGAKDYALRWMESRSEILFKKFKEVYDFAYSSHGLDMTKDSAKTFAQEWVDTKHDKDFSLFIKMYEYAYSSEGLDMTRDGAKTFALDWLDKYSE